MENAKSAKKVGEIAPFPSVCPFLTLCILTKGKKRENCDALDSVPFATKAWLPLHYVLFSRKEKEVKSELTNCCEHGTMTPVAIVCWNSSVGRAADS